MGDLYRAAGRGWVKNERLPRCDVLGQTKIVVDMSADWNSRQDKIIISIASGVPYDIVTTGYYTPYEEGSNRLLAPLDKYVNNWSSKDKYPPQIWETMKWQGKIYVIPQDCGTRAIAYPLRRRNAPPLWCMITPEVRLTLRRTPPWISHQRANLQVYLPFSRWGYPDSQRHLPVVLP